MSRPYFCSPLRVAALDAAASAWLGTPYVVSGAVRDHGASCHRLAGAILTDAGFPVTPPEKGAIRLREFTAAMREWLDNSDSFKRVEGELQPGDVLLCEYGIGHIGLVVSNGLAVQVLRNAPTHLVSLADPNVRERILAAYRPTENHGQ